MQSKSSKRKFSKPRSRYIPKKIRDPWSVFVDRCVQEVDSLQLTKLEREQRDTFVQFVMNCIEDAGGSPSLFGSVAHGTDTIMSDVDIAIDISGMSSTYQRKRYVDRDTIIRHLSIIARRVGNLAVYDKTKRRDVFFKVNTIFHARVPIVKIWDPVYHWQADLSVQMTASHSETVELVYQYVNAFDTRVREFLLLLKTWTKRRKLNDSRTGKMNSFGYAIMGLKCLQQTNPPILPIISIDEITGEWTYTARNTQTYNDNDDINDNNNNKKSKRPPSSWTLADFLLHFFKTFARFDYHRKMIALDQRGYGRKRFMDFPDLRREQMTFVVRDPVNSGNNLGKNVRWQTAEYIQSEFERAANLLENGADWDVLMEEVREIDVPSVDLFVRNNRSRTEFERFVEHIGTAIHEMNREQVMTPPSAEENDEYPDVLLDAPAHPIDQQPDGAVDIHVVEDTSPNSAQFVTMSATETPSEGTDVSPVGKCQYGNGRARLDLITMDGDYDS